MIMEVIMHTTCIAGILETKCQIFHCRVHMIHLFWGRVGWCTNKCFCKTGVILKNSGHAKVSKLNILLAIKEGLDEAPIVFLFLREVHKLMWELVALQMLSDDNFHHPSQ